MWSFGEAVDMTVASHNLLSCVFLFLFFFKQKTAYEMRISDWSSDVCSSDLAERKARDFAGHFQREGGEQEDEQGRREGDQRLEIGRASCRERVCQYV